MDYALKTKNHLFGDLNKKRGTSILQSTLDIQPDILAILSRHS